MTTPTTISVAIEVQLQDALAAIQKFNTSVAQMGQAIGQFTKGSQFQQTSASVRDLNTSFASMEQHVNSVAQAHANAVGPLERFGQVMDRTSGFVSGFHQVLLELVAAGGIVGLGRAVYDVGVQMIGLQRGFDAVTGDAQKTHAEFTFLRELAAKTGYSFYELTQNFLQLAAATKGTGVTMSQAEDIFSALVETSRALGLSTEQTNNALLAVTQMMSKGKVEAQELRLQLGNALPGAVNVFAQALGISTGQLEKMMSSGELLSNDVLPQVAKYLHSTYGEAAALAATTPDAALNRLKDAWRDLLLVIGKSDVLATVTKILEDMTRTLKDPATIAQIQVFAKELSAIIGVIYDLVTQWGAWIASFAAFKVAAGSVSSLLGVVRLLFPALQTMAVAGEASVAAGGWLVRFGSLMGMSSGIVSNFVGKLGTMVEGLKNMAISGAMSVASNGWMLLLVPLAAAATVEIIRLASALKDLHEENKKQVEISKTKQEIDARNVEKLKELSQQTGINITSMKQFNELVQQGVLVWDGAQQKWVASTATLAGVNLTLGQLNQLVAAGKMVWDELHKTWVITDDALKKANIDLNQLNNQVNAGKVYWDAANKTWQLAEVTLTGTTLTIKQLNDMVAKGELVWNAANKTWQAANSSVDVTSQELEQLTRITQANMLVWNSAKNTWELSTQVLNKMNIVTRQQSTYNEDLAKSIAKVEASAKETQQAMENLAKADAFNGTVSGVRMLAAALQELQEKDVKQVKVAFEEMGQILEKMSAKEIANFGKALTQAFKDGVLSAADFRQAMDTTVAAGLKKLGVDAGEAATGIKTAFQGTLDLIDMLAKQADVTGRQIELAFNTAAKAASNTAEYDALLHELENLKNAGKMVGDAYEIAFARVAKKALDDFYEALKKATNVAEVRELKQELEAMFEAGAISSRQYKESLQDADAAMQRLARTSDLTRGELEEFNRLQAEAVKRIQENAKASLQQAEAHEQTARKINDYLDVVDEAKREDEQYSEAMKINAGNLEEQKKLTDEHVKSLESEAKSLEKSAEQERKKADEAKEHVKVLQQQLEMEKARLQNMISSGTATQAEIAAQQQIVDDLNKQLAAAQANAAEQYAIAAAAEQAADEIQKAAEAAERGAEAVNSWDLSFGHQEYSGTLMTYTSNVNDLTKALEGLSKTLYDTTQALSEYDRSMEILKDVNKDSVESISKVLEAVDYQYQQELEKLKSWSVNIIDFTHDTADEIVAILKNSGSLLYQAVAGEIDALNKMKKALEELKLVLLTNQDFEKITNTLDDNFKGIQNQLDKVGSSLHGQVEAYQKWIAEAEQALVSAKDLDEADLSRLKDNINSAKEKLVELVNEAKSATQALEGIGESLKEQLMQMQGDEVGLEQARYEKQLQQIEEEYQKAGEMGKKQYEEDLKLAEELHRRKLEQIKEQMEADGKTYDESKTKITEQSKTQLEHDTIHFNYSMDAEDKLYAKRINYLGKVDKYQTEVEQNRHETISQHLDDEAKKIMNIPSIRLPSFSDSHFNPADQYKSKLYIPQAVPVTSGSTTTKTVHINLTLGGKAAAINVAEPDYKNFLDILETAGMRAM
jgi:tape measure domain-containing protein